MHVGLGLGLTRGQGSGVFSPHHLYQSGDILLWYDPSDLSTMFKDTAGTQPVTADGDSVALMLDKGQWGGKTLEQVLAEQPELVTNGGFDNATGWTLGSGWSISGGQLVGSSVSAAVPATFSAATPTAGRFYLCTYTVVSGSGSSSLNVGGTTGTARASPGTYTEILLATNTTAAQVTGRGAGFTGVIDNVSVKEIPGYHRTQATGTSMPKYKTGPNSAAAENSPELVTNGTFDSDVSGWTAVAAGGTSIAWSGGEALVTNTGSSFGRGYVQAGGFEVGKTYRVTGQARRTAGTGIVQLAVINNIEGTTIAGGGEITSASNVDVSFTFTATETNNKIYMRVTVSGTTGAFDNISVKEIPASAPYIHWLLYDGTDDGHATGTVPFNTVTSDGLARRNLIPNPTALSDTSVWANTSITMTADAVTAPDGTSTGDTLARTSTTFGENNIRRTTTQSTSTEYTFSAYVKENTAGAKLYMRNLAVDNGATNGVVHFDPSDGSVSLTYGSTYAGKATMVSVGDGWYRCAITGTTPGSITNNLLDIGVTNGASAVGGTTGDSVHVWSAQLELGSTATAFQNIGTDEVAVCAGVTKSSDEAAGVFAELSANYGTNAGTFIFLAPDTTLSGYRFGTSGSISQINASTTGFAAPVTKVLAAYSDISSDTAILRANAVQVASSTADQGTGNYGSYAMYFGRRAGTSLPFNGREYQTVIRSRLLSAAELSSLETFVAAKTGVIL